MAVESSCADTAVVAAGAGGDEHACVVVESCFSQVGERWPVVGGGCGLAAPVAVKVVGKECGASAFVFGAVAAFGACAFACHRVHCGQVQIVGSLARLGFA